MPLRPSWKVRLRALAGLVTLVTFLGVATALIVAVLALAGVQALGGI